MLNEPTTEQVRESLAAAEIFLRDSEQARLDGDPFAWMFSPDAIAFAREHVVWARQFLAR
jgi:hypothetical protein